MNTIKGMSYFEKASVLNKLSKAELISMLISANVTIDKLINARSVSTKDWQTRNGFLDLYDISTVANNGASPDCPICRGAGEYHIGGSFGGPIATYKCHCSK